MSISFPLLFLAALYEELRLEKSNSAYQKVRKGAGNETERLYHDFEK